MGHFFDALCMPLSMLFVTLDPLAHVQDNNFRSKCFNSQATPCVLIWRCCVQRLCIAFPGDHYKYWYVDHVPLTIGVCREFDACHERCAISPSVLSVAQFDATHLERLRSYLIIELYCCQSQDVYYSPPKFTIGLGLTTSVCR